MTNSFKILDAYSRLFYSDKTYFVVSGGRSSGKSVNCAAYILTKLLDNEPNRIVIARYTAKSLTNSLYQDILDLINLWGIGSMLKINEDQILNLTNGNLIFTHALKISDGTQTAKSKGISAANILFCDEAIEIPTLQHFLRLADSFRVKDRDLKIILAFNPESKSHWIFQYFFNPDGSPKAQHLENTEFIHTTYLDNIVNINPAKIREWEQTKIHNPEYYHYDIMGNWKPFGEGQIFTNWDWNSFAPDPESEIVYGLDFGFASDPTALVRVYKRGNHIWLEELLYETGLITEDVSARMEQLGIPKKATIKADSADPRSIETLKRLGWFNIQKSFKGPDSVRHGIDRIKSYQVHASPYSKNLSNEYQFYSYRSGTDKPIDAYNHCFVGDTLIETINGKVKIKDIKIGDFVLTRNGYRKVLKVFDNGIKEVKKYEIFDGNRYINITSTEEHLIWQNNSWSQISQLREGSEIVLLNGSMEKNTDYTKIIPIGQTEHKECTSQFGNSIMVPFPKDSKYIIKTRTKAITKSKIWNWFREKNMHHTTLKKESRKTLSSLKDFKMLVKRLQQPKCHHGEKPMKEKNFTQRLGQCLTNQLSQHSLLVNNVGKNFKRKYSKKFLTQGNLTPSIPNIVTSTVGSVQCTKEGKSRVYDLHIEEDHEYFANGLLVHNCMDAIRYAIEDLTDTPKYAVMGRLNRNEMMF